jgi:hypothetical protein
MTDRKAFNCSVVFLTTVSHVVWGLCINYDCGMSDTYCFSAHAAVHETHDEHNSSSERIHSDSCHSEVGFGPQQSKRFTFEIPCSHGDRHEETPHRHGSHCVGTCSAYLLKLPQERQTFPLSRLVASFPSGLETPLGLSNILTAERSIGSGDFRFKRPLHPLQSVLLL